MIEKDAEEENVYEETKQNIAYAHNTHTYTYQQLVRERKWREPEEVGDFFDQGGHTHTYTHNDIIDFHEPMKFA